METRKKFVLLFSYATVLKMWTLVSEYYWKQRRFHQRVGLSSVVNIDRNDVNESAFHFFPHFH